MSRQAIFVDGSCSHFRLDYVVDHPSLTSIEFRTATRHLTLKSIGRMRWHDNTVFRVNRLITLFSLDLCIKNFSHHEAKRDFCLRWSSSLRDSDGISRLFQDNLYESLVDATMTIMKDHIEVTSFVTIHDGLLLPLARNNSFQRIILPIVASVSFRCPYRVRTKR